MGAQGIVTAEIVLIDPTADLQAAIDATPAYGTLRVPAGIFTPKTAAGFSITKPITIEGSGAPYLFENLGIADTCTFTSTQFTITLSSPARSTSVLVGMSVSGTGIGTNAVVSSVDPATGIVTVSVANSGSGPSGVTFSAGPGLAVGWTNGTVIRVYNAAGTSDGGMNSTAFSVVAPAGGLQGVIIRNLGIENPYVIPTFTGTAGTNTKVRVPIGTGDGVAMDSTNGTLQYVRLENLSIRFMGRSAVRCGGFSLAQSCDQSTFSRVLTAGCRGDGIYIYYATDLVMDNCGMTGHEQCGLYSWNCAGFKQYHNVYLGNGKSFVNSGQDDAHGGTASLPYYHMAQCYLLGTSRWLIEGCDFEAWNTSDVPHAIGVESASGGVIVNNSTYNSTYPTPTGGDAAPNPDSVLIDVKSLSSGIFVAANQAAGCTYAIRVASAQGSRGITVLPFFISGDGSAGSPLAPCKVDVANDLDTDASTNGPSCGNIAYVPLIDGSTNNDLKNMAAGIQIPRVSAVAAITAAVKDGTLVDDVGAGKLKLRRGGAWVDIG